MSGERTSVGHRSESNNTKDRPPSNRRSAINPSEGPSQGGVSHEDIGVAEKCDAQTPEQEDSEGSFREEPLDGPVESEERKTTTPYNPRRRRSVSETLEARYEESGGNVCVCCKLM